MTVPAVYSLWEIVSREIKKQFITVSVLRIFMIFSCVEGDRLKYAWYLTGGICNYIYCGNGR